MKNNHKVRLTVTISDPDSDVGELQQTIERLLPQMREVDGVDTADLVISEEAPAGSKAVGGFLLGMMTAEVNVANVKKLLGFLGERLGDKQIELVVKAPDGRELSLKAGSQADFEYAFQKAQEFLNP